MKALSLFSGIGGIDLACEWAGIETVAFCEREPFPQKVLRKHWPDVPIYDDVCTLTKERLEDDGIGTIELIHGGYPCQPFSLAGKREGTDDDRHLWPEVFRLIQAIQPRWFVGENVAGHITLGLDTVLSDLDSIGYAAEAFVIPAASVNARHRRDRVFIVAHSTRQLSHRSREAWDRWTKHSNGSENVADTTGERCREKRELRRNKPEEWVASSGENVSRTNGSGLQGSEKAGNVGRSREKAEQQFTRHDKAFITHPDCQPRLQTGTPISTIRSKWDAWNDAGWRSRGYVSGADWWATEPEVGRVANGIPHRVDRLKALGNAVVPQQIYPILAAIKQIDDMLQEEAV